MLICIAFFAVGSALAGASQNMVGTLEQHIPASLADNVPVYSQ